jgi:molecular chaperone Hsp33
LDGTPEDSVSVAVAFGTLSRGLNAEATARVVAVEMDEIVRLGASLHQLNEEALRFYGESMVAAALLSAQIKGAERLTVQIQSERPNMAFVCDVRGDGAVRGRMSPAVLSKRRSGTYQGVLLAIKSVDNREVYRGVTAIDDCSIAEALATHLSDSQQVKSALRIHVATEEAGRVIARGLLMEQLPGEAGLANSDSLVGLDEAVESADFDASITALCARGDQTVLGHQALFWRCECSQERVESVIQMLGAEALAEMIADEQETSVQCHFCSCTRTVSVERLREILASCAS